MDEKEGKPMTEKTPDGGMTEEEADEILSEPLNKFDIDRWQQAKGLRRGLALARCVFIDAHSTGFDQGRKHQKEKNAAEIASLRETVKDLREALYDLVGEVSIADNAHAYDFLAPAVAALAKHKAGDTGREG